MEQHNKNNIVIQIIRKQNKKMTKSQFKQIKKLFESLSELKINTTRVYIEGTERINGIEFNPNMNQFKIKDLLQLFISYLCYIQNLNPIYLTNGNHSYSVGNFYIITINKSRIEY